MIWAARSPTISKHAKENVVLFVVVVCVAAVLLVGIVVIGFKISLLILHSVELPPTVTMPVALTAGFSRPCQKESVFTPISNS